MIRVDSEIERVTAPRYARWATPCCVAVLLSASVEPAAAQQTPTAPEPAQLTPPQSVVAPQVVHRVDAIYPADALATRHEGTVGLLVTVDLEGHVKDAVVSESAGASLDDAALAAVRQWTFTPARRGDEPVLSRIRVPFTFALPSVEVPEPTAATPTSATAAQPGATGATAPPPSAASAAPSAPATAEPSATPAAEPIDVTVLGKRRPPSRGSSDYQLDVGGLATVPRQNASELLKLAPGILLTNEGGDAHAEQIFLRGFDAREGQDLELSADGAPINEVGNLHGNGYADTHFLIPELVSSLRVLEGPFDPRQGNFAVAGSADYELGLAQRGVTAKLSTGSFGTTRTLLLWGPEHASNGTYAGVDLYQTNGYGQNRDGRRGSMLAQYEAHSGDTTYRVGATAYAASFHSAGLLRADDYAAGRVGFYDTYDTGQGEDVARYSVHADVESHADDLLVRNQLYAILRPMRLREDFTGFLLDPQEPQQSTHGQRGDLIDLAMQERTFGARGSARLGEHALGLPQELEVGYFARGDFANGEQERIESATGHPYHVDSKLDSSLADLGLYADLNFRMLSWLALRGGLRADLFTYDVLNQCAVQSASHALRSNPPGDQSCLSQQDFGAYREPDQRVSTIGSAYMPRASLIAGPFFGFTASTSYGLGVRSIDPIYVQQDGKTPFASASSAEVGLSYTRKLDAVELGARTTLFQTRVDHDLIFSETAGRNTLGGATTRVGSANSLRVTGRSFDVSTNVTYVHATFDDTGLLIPYVPDLVVRLDAALFGPLFPETIHVVGKPLRGTLSTGVTYVGARPLPQGERSDVIFTVDLNASVGWSIFELGLLCTNLLDTQYRLGEYDFASDFHRQANPALPTLVPTRLFSAGAPRSLLATLTIHFGEQP